MTQSDVLTLITFFIVISGGTYILGEYMYAVFSKNNYTWLKIPSIIEIKFYKIMGINPDEEMNYKEYLSVLLIFNFIGAIVLLFILMAQGILPFNPQHLAGVPFWLAFNTTISFVTNTNWQAYSGENTLSYLSQFSGLTVHNFLSAATGITVLLAFARAFKTKPSHELGNFWVDLTKTLIYLFLPLSIILSIFLISQGVVQTFSPYITATTIEGSKQLIPLGPAASQIAIKQLGTNGGGFFGVNSAHPFENATPFSNFLEMISLLLIPAALPYTFGRLIGSRRQGMIIWSAMAILLITGLGIGLWAEYQGNSALSGLPFMEGKEVRFGITNSVLWGVSTTATANGSVNAMHSSFAPITGMIATINLMLGEIIYGGVGTGLTGMLMYVILTVFITGLMVGRTPEYLGKKIEAREIKLAIITILIPSALILIGSMIASTTQMGLSSLGNKGPHGLMEILYTYSSCSQNNGSAFGGLNANTAFYNSSLGICMLIGRLVSIIFPLAIAGNLAQKKYTPPSLGTFPTDNMLFVTLLIGVILIVGGLTFFPALSLGSIVEHILMQKGILF
ncbi:MAG: potassium-transporting ATPase subunit KdpA [Nitrospirae bacterium]|nr:potassium-transporting ATPase subunit KdpA [Nitrospirota bacterium]